MLQPEYSNTRRHPSDCGVTASKEKPTGQRASRALPVFSCARDADIAVTKSERVAGVRATPDRPQPEFLILRLKVQIIDSVAPDALVLLVCLPQMLVNDHTKAYAPEAGLYYLFGHLGQASRTSPASGGAIALRPVQNICLVLVCALVLQNGVALSIGYPDRCDGRLA